MGVEARASCRWAGRLVRPGHPHRGLCSVPHSLWPGYSLLSLRDPDAWGVRATHHPQRGLFSVPHSLWQRYSLLSLRDPDAWGVRATRRRRRGPRRRVAQTRPSCLGAVGTRGDGVASARARPVGRQGSSLLSLRNLDASSVQATPSNGSPASPIPNGQGPASCHWAGRLVRPGQLGGVFSTSPRCGFVG